ncbi:MAG: hypothetical protein PVI20_02305 [Desulfobacteraceae bacterium]
MPSVRSRSPWRRMIIPAQLSRAPAGKFNGTRSEVRGILAYFGKAFKRL